jgi:hypothetical protein
MSGARLPIWNPLGLFETPGKGYSKSSLAEVSGSPEELVLQRNPGRQTVWKH